MKMELDHTLDMVIGRLSFKRCGAPVRPMKSEHELPTVQFARSTRQGLRIN